MHCHLDYHMDDGMAMLIRVGKVSDVPPAPKPTWSDCALKNFETISSVSSKNNSNHSISFKYNIFLISIVFFYKLISKLF